MLTILNCLFFIIPFLYIKKINYFFKKLWYYNVSDIKFVPSHFKTQEMCERAVKRLSYASFQYVPDQYIDPIDVWEWYFKRSRKSTISPEPL